MATDVMAHLLQQSAGRKALDALGQDLCTGLPVIDARQGEVVDPDDLSRVDLAGSSGGRPVFLVEGGMARSHAWGWKVNDSTP